MRTLKISDSQFFSVIFPVCLAVLFLVLNYIFINWDNSSVNTDYHLFRSYRFYSGTIMDSYKNLRENPFPPLVYMVSSFFWYIAGFSYKWGLLSLQLFSLIFILSMYGIGYELGGRTGAICTGFLAAASPHVMNYSRLYLLDFPQTAMTALSFWLLLKTEFFTNRKFSILFGIAFALSMMTKWSSLIFLLFPVLWFVIPHIRKSRKALIIFTADLLLMIFLVWRSAGHLRLVWGKVNDIWLSSYLVNIFIPVVIFIAIMLAADRKSEDPEDGMYPMLNFSYSIVFPVILTTLWIYAAAEPIASKIYTDTFLTDLGNNEYVLLKIPSLIFERILLSLKTQFSYAPLLLLIGLIFLFLVKREQRFRLLVLPLSLAASILIFIKIGFPDNRYFISFIIFTAPLGTYWINRVEKIKKYIVVCIVILSILSISGWMLSYDGLLDKILLPVERQPSATLLKGQIISPFVLISEIPEHTCPCLADVIKNNSSTFDVFDPRYIPCVVPSSRYFSSEDFMLEGINQGKYYFVHKFNNCEALLQFMKKVNMSFQEVVIFEPSTKNIHVEEIAKKLSQYQGKRQFRIHRFIRERFSVYLIILDDYFNED